MVCFALALYLSHPTVIFRSWRASPRSHSSLLVYRPLSNEVWGRCAIKCRAPRLRDAIAMSMPERRGQRAQLPVDYIQPSLLPHATYFHSNVDVGGLLHCLKCSRCTLWFYPFDWCRLRPPEPSIFFAQYNIHTRPLAPAIPAPDIITTRPDSSIMHEDRWLLP